MDRLDAVQSSNCIGVYCFQLRYCTEIAVCNWQGWAGFFRKIRKWHRKERLTFLRRGHISSDPPTRVPSQRILAARHCLLVKTNDSDRENINTTTSSVPLCRQRQERSIHSRLGRKRQHSPCFDTCNRSHRTYFYGLQKAYRRLPGSYTRTVVKQIKPRRTYTQCNTLGKLA